MKKYIYILSCLFVFLPFSNSLADDVSEAMNKKIRWNGTAVKEAVENSYLPYTRVLFENLKTPMFVSIEEIEEEIETAIKEENNLLKKLLKAETFSLNDALDWCISNRSVTPNVVCEDLVHNLMNLASKTEPVAKSVKTEPVAKSVSSPKPKKQLCRAHKLKFSGHFQRGWHDEFLYATGIEAIEEFGYECDPGGAEEACDAGDEVKVLNGVLGTKTVSGTFRCVRGIDDKWEKVSDDTRSHH